jgi:hypothetical protein
MASPAGDMGRLELECRSVHFRISSFFRFWYIADPKT